ncbi:hypothetical protein [Nocardia farcinica]
MPSLKPAAEQVKGFVKWRMFDAGRWKVLQFRAYRWPAGIAWGNRHRVVVSAAGLLLLVGVVVGNSCWEWGLSWGNVATWFSAAASASVAVAVLIATRRYNEAQDRTKAEVRATGVWLKTVPVETATPESLGQVGWVTTLTNDTDSPIYHLKFREKVRAVSAATGDESTFPTIVLRPNGDTDVPLEARKSLTVVHVVAAETAKSHTPYIPVSFADSDGFAFTVGYSGYYFPPFRFSTTWVCTGKADKSEQITLVIP